MPKLKNRRRREGKEEGETETREEEGGKRSGRNRDKGGGKGSVLTFVVMDKFVQGVLIFVYVCIFLVVVWSCKYRLCVVII